MVGTTHAEIICSPALRLIKTKWLKPKISNFHRFNTGLMSIAHVSWPKKLGPLGFFCSNSTTKAWFMQYAVSSEQLILRCVCYLNSVKHLFRLQFLRLVTLMNLSGSSFPVAVLMRASFIIVLDGFCDCTWRNLHESNDRLSFLFDYLIIWVLP